MMIVISEPDGTAVGVFNDAQIPRAGDEISVERNDVLGSVRADRVLE
jgi:hypothetical protein